MACLTLAFSLTLDSPFSLLAELGSGLFYQVLEGDLVDPILKRPLSSPF